MGKLDDFISFSLVTENGTAILRPARGFLQKTVCGEPTMMTRSFSAVEFERITYGLAC